MRGQIISAAKRICKKSESGLLKFVWPIKMGVGADLKQKKNIELIV